MVCALAITLLLSVSETYLTTGSHQGRPAAGARLNELKVRAMGLGGKLSTDGGRPVIDRAAASGFGIQKMAGFADIGSFLRRRILSFLPHLGIAPAAVSSVTSKYFAIV